MTSVTGTLTGVSIGCCDISIGLALLAASAYIVILDMVVCPMSVVPAAPTKQKRFSLDHCIPNIHLSRVHVNSGHCFRCQRSSTWL